MDVKKYNTPNVLAYALARLASFGFASVVFRRKILRNELKHVKGPCIVIANHQAAYDFANLIGTTSRRLTFVISNSMYNSMVINPLLKWMGVIPKQQFQTSVADMKRMKAAVDHGQALVVYPAGLMCEDGVSTPIPKATYKFLKWLNVDVYVARTSGTYFVMPKWTKGFRMGRTYLDVHKLFEKETLAQMDEEEIRRKTEIALFFDAYREQENLLVEYRNGDNVQGLENVVYMCPHCNKEFTIRAIDRKTLRCESCGYEQQSDRFSFLHNHKQLGPEYRYISDWSHFIYEKQRQILQKDDSVTLTLPTKIHMIDYRKHKFVEVGYGQVSVSRTQLALTGTINGEQVEITIPSVMIPTLPFSPGKYVELQQRNQIYRCVLEDGRYAMKFINMLKAFYELNHSSILV